MTKLKVGDKVRRTDNFKTFQALTPFDVDGVYTVMAVGHDGVWIDVDHPCRDRSDPYPFSSRMFALVEDIKHPATKDHPFKPGDKVVREGCGVCGVQKGSIHTVKATSSDSPFGDLIHWITIDGCVSTQGSDFLFHSNLFRKARYSEYFTEQADKPADGGHIQGSPIQKHSKGPYYPLCVVGYSDTGRTAFTIENLEDGTVLGFAPEEFSGSSNIRAWGNAHQAYAYLDSYIKQQAFKKPWVKGRPTFIKNGYGLEVVIPPKHKRWAVQLLKLNTPSDAIAINGAYYKALEQDIG